MAARGGLEGGDSRAVEGASGIPLCPCDARSAVVEPLQRRSAVDEVAAGKDIGLADNVLAIIITTVIDTLLFQGRHLCCWAMLLFDKGLETLSGG